MKLLYRWLGAEIVFVHVGHGLVGVGIIAVLAVSIPWWFTLALTPLIAFSLAFWLKESQFVMPVARRYLSGNPHPEGNWISGIGDGPDTNTPIPHFLSPADSPHRPPDTNH